MERFVIIVNGWKPLTNITKRSILDVTAALEWIKLEDQINGSIGFQIGGNVKQKLISC